jgi:hypothetical protein
MALGRRGAPFGHFAARTYHAAGEARRFVEGIQGLRSGVIAPWNWSLRRSIVEV